MALGAVVVPVAFKVTDIKAETGARRYTNSAPTKLIFK